MRLISSLVILGLVSGCSTPMTQEGSQVRQIRAEAVTPCKFISVVQGTNSTSWGVARDRANALNKVRNQVAELGGNAYVLTQTNTDEWGTNTQVDAYNCPP
jgi:hypothetical protein